MICNNCGAQLDPDTLYCPYCGVQVTGGSADQCPECAALVDSSCDTCPYCGAPLIHKSKKMKNKRRRIKRRNQNRRGPSLFPIILLLLIFIVAIIVFVRVKPWQRTEEAGVDQSDEAGKPENDIEEPVPEDIKAYYEENAAIIDRWSVSDSKTIKTEAEVIDDLQDRGFSDYPAESEYSIDGEYSDAQVISESGKDKHPIYKTYYVNTSGEIWTIMVLDDCTVAYPVTYNMEHGTDVQLIISESEKIVSYDSHANVYYRTIPNSSVLNIKVVNRIDAETLNSLTVEELNDL